MKRRMGRGYVASRETPQLEILSGDTMQVSEQGQES